MFEKKMKNKKILVGLIILIVVGIFLINKFYITGKSVESLKTVIVPLNSEQNMKVIDILNSSDFIKDMPKNGVISLRFFSFPEGERVWHDAFLIGKDKILSEGNPDIYLVLHSKYISEFNKNNLCEIIKSANKNGDLGFNSEYSKARLFFKYAGMLKHRACFGF